MSCTQTSDEFSVANGNLKHPVALITIDELSFASGRVRNIDNQFYLYTGQEYWTMSPSCFSSPRGVAFAYLVFEETHIAGDYVSSKLGVRPVINLKSNVKITKGTGTVSNPYELTIE